MIEEKIRGEILIFFKKKEKKKRENWLSHAHTHTHTHTHTHRTHTHTHTHTHKQTNKVVFLNQKRTEVVLRAGSLRKRQVAALQKIKIK